jgi:hypothetical protein
VHGAERHPAGSPPDHQRNAGPDDGESESERGRAIHSKRKGASLWPRFPLEKQKRITELLVTRF